MFSVYFWGTSVLDLWSPLVVTAVWHPFLACPSHLINLVAANSLTLSWPCRVNLMTFLLAYDQGLSFCFLCHLLLNCFQFSIVLGSIVLNLSSYTCATKLNDSTAVASVSTKPYQAILLLLLSRKTVIVRCEAPTALREAPQTLKLCLKAMTRTILV